MESRQKTLKPTANKDLAGIVRDYAFSAVESGELLPSLSEGLRAQEIIDRRSEKSSDRDLAMTLASILGGGGTTYQVIEAKKVDEIV